METQIGAAIGQVEILFDGWLERARRNIRRKSGAGTVVATECASVTSDRLRTQSASDNSVLRECCVGKLNASSHLFSRLSERTLLSNFAQFVLSIFPGFPVIFLPFSPALSPSPANSIPTPKKGPSPPAPYYFLYFYGRLRVTSKPFVALFQPAPNPRTPHLQVACLVPHQPKSFGAASQSQGNHHRRHIYRSHPARI